MQPFYMRYMFYTDNQIHPHRNLVPGRMIAARCDNAPYHVEANR